MDTYVCDISALEYWKTPPLVSSILQGDDACAGMLRIKSREEYEQFCQEALLDCVPGGDPRLLNAKHAHSSSHSRTILEWLPILANCRWPIRILARNRSELGRADVWKAVLWSGDIPPGSFVQVADELHIATPEFALLQVAKHETFGACIMQASELCGSYAEFNAPNTIARKLMQQSISGIKGTEFEGWRPYIASNGVASTWQRPQLTDPRALNKMAKLADCRRGTRRLLDISGLVTPGAASPFESKAGLLLTLPNNMGGFGQAGMEHNKPVQLTASSRWLSGKHRCLCDLYWDEGVDIECQSALAHDNESSFLSDSERTAALLCEGITVLPLTYSVMASQTRFSEFAETLIKLRGLPARHNQPPRQDKMLKLRQELGL